MEAPAEEILRRLQRQMLEQAEAKPLAAFAPVEDRHASASGSSRRILRSLEEAWGGSATQEGRWLDDLLQGSAAWEIIERPLPGRKRRDAPPPPRFHEISRCEPLLQIMRESGELTERERLLHERDTVLRAIGQDAALSEGARQQAARAAYERYFADVARLTETYRPYYQELRRALGTIAPLTGPRVRSRPLLLPPLMAHLFRVCHADKDTLFAPAPDEARSGSGGPRIVSAAYQRGPFAVRAIAPTATLLLLDEMTWDIAAVAVSAFFVRTSGSDPDARFPLLIDDYFEWRGVDPRKRTLEARQEIDRRIRALCSEESLLLETQSELWLTDPQNPARRRTSIATRGAFLVRQSGLFRPSPWLSETENEPLYGHLISVGEWARPFIEARAMLGVFPRQLAGYDRRRQQWERRIGWYLTFQMQNQGSRMRFSAGKEEAGRMGDTVTPQHSLKMKTVLQNSHVPYEEMARTNPGKVIKQWIETLETLKRDGILGGYFCMDGAADGSDLPTRSRLSAMLEYRYEFTPGGDLAERLRRKSAGRAAHR